MSASGSEPPGETLDAGELFRRHGRFVAGFLWKIGVKSHEVDDLVQAVFMVAHQKGGFAIREARPTTWLARIALRVAAVRRRSERRSPESPASNVIHAAVASQPSPSDQLEVGEGLRRVQQALECLDLDHRAVFVLYEIDGESCASIASGMELPLGTVHSRLHTARKKFTKAHAQLVAADRWRAAGSNDS